MEKQRKTTHVMQCLEEIGMINGTSNTNTMPRKIEPAITTNMASQARVHVTNATPAMNAASIGERTTPNTGGPTFAQA